MPKPHPLKMLRIPFRHTGLCDFGAGGGSRTHIPKARLLKTLRIPFRHTGKCDLVVPTGIEPVLTGLIRTSLYP